MSTFNLPAQREAIQPDAVYSPGQTSDAAPSEKHWEALNPCPLCGAVQHDAPEGINLQGDPHWNFPHCHKCGFRPGMNTAVDQATMQAQFRQFQEWMQSQTQQDLQHPTLQPPDPNEVEALKAQIAEMQSDLSRYRSETDLAPKPTVAEQQQGQ